MRAGHAAVRRPARVGTAAGGGRRGGRERVEPRAALVAHPARHQAGLRLPHHATKSCMQGHATQGQLGCKRQYKKGLSNLLSK